MSFYGLVTIGEFIRGALPEVIPPDVLTDPDPPTGDLILYVGGRGSTDIYKYNGTSWSTLTVSPSLLEDNTDVFWGSLACQPNNNLKVLAFAGTSTGYLVLTKDGGNTWDGLNLNFIDTLNSIITWCNIDFNGYLYVAVVGNTGEDGGIWRSIDDGQNWDHVMIAGPNLDPDDGLSAQGIRHCAITIGQQYWMIAPHATGPNSGHIIESAMRDAGDPWTLIHADFINYDPDTSSIYYRSGALYRGKNSKVWYPIGYSTSGEFTENYDLFVFTQTGVRTGFQFTNSGAAPHLEGPETIAIVDYEDGTIVVAGPTKGAFSGGGTGDVWRSEDDGETWAHLIAASTDHKAINFLSYGPIMVKDVNGNDLYLTTYSDNIGGGKKTLKSVDKGTTWTNISPGATDVVNTDGIIACGRGNDAFVPSEPALWAGTSRGLKVFDGAELQNTYIGSSSIYQIDSPLGYPEEIFISDPFNLDQTVIKRTTDFGLTWEEILPPDTGCRFNFVSPIQVLDTGKLLAPIFHQTDPTKNGPRIYDAGSWAARITPLYQDFYFYGATCFIIGAKLWTSGRISGSFFSTTALVFAHDGDLDKYHQYNADGTGIAHVTGIPAQFLSGTWHDLEYGVAITPNENRIYSFGVYVNTAFGGDGVSIKRIDNTTITDVTIGNVGGATNTYNKIVWAPTEDIVFAITDDGGAPYAVHLFRSANAGASWTEITELVPFGWSCESVGRTARQQVFTENPNTPGEYYFASTYNIYKSVDYGVTWTIVYDGSVAHGSNPPNSTYFRCIKFTG